MTALIANASGIFGVYSMREVFDGTPSSGQVGTGREFALGAMNSQYQRMRNATAIATAGIEGRSDVRQEFRAADDALHAAVEVSVYQPRSFVARRRRCNGASDPRLSIRDIDHGAPTEPQISHLPLLFHAEPEPNGILVGHMARANPHWRRFAEGPTIGRCSRHPMRTCLRRGTPIPEKAGPDLELRGRSRARPGRAWWRIGAATLAILHEMVERFESGRTRTMAAATRRPRAGRDGQRNRGLPLVIERVDTKLKLSQNRSAIDQQRG
jgi:hypothetical protein